MGASWWVGFDTSSRLRLCEGHFIDYPVLLIDSDASLHELHACASERLNAALADLHLIACSNVSDYAEHDINTVANTARIMVHDVVV
ncbi:hypothetical protein QFZ38_004123 [Pseudomonas cedrina]|nr:hypothetical protein [Pseudomonas cedrina]